MHPRPAVLLVRHGQSEWNAAGRWQGAADSPLTEAGRRQARAAALVLADRSANEPFDRVWSSDLGRAVETATVIADVLGITDVRRDARFREADAGPWEGLRRAEIDRRWPGFLDDDRRPDGFELPDALVARSLAACQHLLNAEPHVDRSIVVTHSGVIRALRRHLGADDHRIPNLGGCWISAADPRTGAPLTLGPTVVLVDDTGPTMTPTTPHAETTDTEETWRRGMTSHRRGDPST